MKRLNQCLIIITMFLFSVSSFAEGNLPASYLKGKVITNKGETLEGYIMIDYSYPQRFQSSVTFLTPEVYEKLTSGSTVKRKEITTFKPKDIEGFELDNGQIFKTVRYANVSSTTTSGMMPSKVCLEQIVNGKISIYRRYSPTSGAGVPLDVADASAKGGQYLVDFIQNNFQLLYQDNPDRDPRSVIIINIAKIVSDQEEVKNNYDQNFYGFKEQFTKKPSIYGTVDKEYEGAFLKLVNDYNSK